MGASAPPVWLGSWSSPRARLMSTNDRCFHTETPNCTNLTILGMITLLIVNLTLWDLTRANLCQLTTVTMLIVATETTTETRLLWWIKDASMDAIGLTINRRVILIFAKQWSQHVLISVVVIRRATAPSVAVTIGGLRFHMLIAVLLTNSRFLPLKI